MTLRHRADDRAVSELLGGIFLFALLLAVVVLAQVALVPTLNQQVEYEHSLRAQGDLADLQSAVSRAINTGGAETVPVEMGVTYPSRFLLLNPAPAAGELRAGDPLPDGVVLRNVAVPDSADTDEYWRALADHAYESRILGYAADYNEFGSASRTVIEGNVMFQRHDDADVVSSRSALVDGRQINLVVLAGTLATSRTDELGVDVRAVSGPTRTVTVTDDGTPISISVRTLLSEDQWRDRLADEQYVNQSAIVYDDPDGDPETANTLTVTLRPDVTYSLRMGKVGIGGGVDREPAAYLTRPVGQTAVVPESGGDLVTEVRDAFNNPVAGENVTYEFAGLDGQATLSWGNESIEDVGQILLVRSDADGRAAPRLTGTASAVEVNATIEADGTAGTADYETVSFAVQIGSGSGDDDGDGGDGNDGNPADEINPYGDGIVSLEGAVTLDDGDEYTGKTRECGNGDCRVVLTLNNSIGQSVGVESVRINAYNLDSKDNGKKAVPAKFDVVGTSSDIGVMGRNPDYLNGVAIPANKDDYQLEIRILNEDGDSLKIDKKDTFFVTIVYDGAPKATYYVTF